MAGQKMNIQCIHRIFTKSQFSMLWC